MDKETLSHYGWIVVLILVLSVMLALATPFGDYVGDGVVSIARGFVGTGDTALSDDNIDNLGDKYENMFNDGTEEPGEPDPPTEPEDPDPEDPGDIILGDKIPDGGIYYVGILGNTTGDYTDPDAVYEGGDNFPDTIKDGDIFVYGDYEYRYNRYHTGSKWESNSNLRGWGVRVLRNDKSSYGKIFESINSKNIKSLQGTFHNCKNLTTAPTMPSNVLSMRSTFYGCDKLQTAPAIPSKVTDMHETFYGCALITKAPVLPDTLKIMHSTFRHCTSLIEAPEVPSKVTDLGAAFQGCTAMVKGPSVIPEKVLNIATTFYGCTNLTGNIQIYADPNTYIDCFKNTTKRITITVLSVELKEKLADTANNGNVIVFWGERV